MDVSAKPVPTPGPLSRPYWHGAVAGELRIQRCASCSTAFLYPRRWCPACWSTDVRWEPASGRGEVFSFSVITQAPLVSYGPDAPYVVAVIRLEEGPQLMANIVGSPAADVRVGLPVEVTFEWRGELAVPQFTIAR